MNLIILASSIVLIIAIASTNKKNNKTQKQKEQEFWEKEYKANSVRKKPLDDLDYISIPFDNLPTETEKEDEVIASCLRDLEGLRDQKIVNFTGFTNTDLKLEYGTANITVLSQYDQNYTLLVRTLQAWAQRLYELGHHKEALIVLEFALDTRTDISATYYLAASLYHENGQDEKILQLLAIADTLRSAMKNPIVRTLKESYPDIG